MNVLITGAAGFIGFHLARRLLDEGDQVCGIDNLNAYYDVSLKEARLGQLQAHPNFKFERLELADRSGLEALFKAVPFNRVVNLAAQAGVRHSLENPFSYIDSNIVGFTNLLEACRHHPVEHLVFASSSSVYGANTKVPFSVDDSVDRPVSLYAATKKANELMAYTYSHLYGIPVTGLRFFTVYGPWGRPDMAYFKFVAAVLQNTPIDVYNFGHMERDFTYIDDIVEGLVRVLRKAPQKSDLSSELSSSELSKSEIASPPYRLYNIGNHAPVQLLRFIEIIEQVLEKTVPKNFLPMQPGEVLSTYADIEGLVREFGFRPNTTLEDGIAKFVAWYRDYYQI